MRVVSLAPSATATLAAADAADLLVGVTTHCDPGPEVDPDPVGGWLNPDYDRVAGLDPDLVLTSDGLQAEVRDDLRDRGLDVFHQDPATLDEAIDAFAALGEAVGRADAGERLRRDARRRLARVREAADGRGRPTVYCEEWSDPPMAGGNWVPEAVRAAGGDYPFCDPGERSREVSRREVEAADPDHVVLHVCGHGDRVDPDDFRRRDWDLDAAVHVLDDSLLNQPSPNLVDGVERLAAVLHGIDGGVTPAADSESATCAERDRGS